MNEYRKLVSHDPETAYAWVFLGPIPGKPAWHEQSKPSQYPFPTNAGAELFAKNNKADYPDREVSVVHLDGQTVQIGG